MEGTGADRRGMAGMERREKKRTGTEGTGEEWSGTERQDWIGGERNGEEWRGREGNGRRD